MYLSVVLPTYNERSNIVRLIKEIKRVLKEANVRCEILVIDDNSPDGTAKLVNEEFGRDNNVNVIRRIEERGLATAVKEGIERSKLYYWRQDTGPDFIRLRLISLRRFWR